MVPSSCCLWELRPASGPGPFMVTSTEALPESFTSLVFNLFSAFLLVWLLSLPVVLCDSVSWVLCKCSIYRSRMWFWAVGWTTGRYAPCPSQAGHAVPRSICWHRHFKQEETDSWGLGCTNLWLCCPASRWRKDGRHQTHQYWGLLFKKETQTSSPVLCKHLETVLLRPVGPPSPYLAANGWTPPFLPAWALPRRDACLTSSGRARAGLRVWGLRWGAASGSSLGAF